MANNKKRSYQRLMTWYRSKDGKIPLFNLVARTALRAKYQFDYFSLNQIERTDPSEVIQELNQPLHIFGYSSPRSGTVFLTHLLKQEMADTNVQHEANIVDYLHLAKATNDLSNADNYISKFRLKDIYKRFKKGGQNRYVEINPFLRLHCQALKKCLPNATHFRMVRDGRDVVRSVMSRDKLGPKDPILKLIRPPKNDPYFDLWNTMSRFERTCWQWQFTNRYMRQHLDHVLYFEKLKQDFDYCKIQLDKLFGIAFTSEKWKLYFDQPKNISPKYRIAHWQEWDSKTTQTFNDICGEEMKMNGYS